MIEVIEMHKKDALTVVQLLSDDMEKHPYLDSDFNAYTANGHLPGRPSITVTHASNTGSDSGLSKAVLSGDCANFPATAGLNCSVLRTTGLNKCLRNSLITPGSSIWSMMPPISIRTGVYSIL